MPKGQGEKTVKSVMHDYKSGTLHSGSKEGPIVHNRKQAIAIAMSEAKGDFTPSGHADDAHSPLGAVVQNTSEGGQPTSIGTFSGSRHGYERAE